MTTKTLYVLPAEIVDVKLYQQFKVLETDPSAGLPLITLVAIGQAVPEVRLFPLPERSSHVVIDVPLLGDEQEPPE